MLVDVIFLDTNCLAQGMGKGIVNKFIWYVIFVYFLVQQVVLLICRFSILAYLTVKFEDLNI